MTEDSAETKNVADDRARPADRDDRHVVRRGRQVQRAADRRPRACNGSPRSARRSRATASRYVLYPDTQSVPAAAAPKILNRAFSISAEVEMSPGAEGVLLSMGGNDGGIAFYVQDGKLIYVHNYVARTLST